MDCLFISVSKFTFKTLRKLWQLAMFWYWHFLGHWVGFQSSTTLFFNSILFQESIDFSKVARVIGSLTYHGLKSARCCSKIFTHSCNQSKIGIFTQKRKNWVKKHTSWLPHEIKHVFEWFHEITHIFWSFHASCMQVDSRNHKEIKSLVNVLETMKASWLFAFSLRKRD